MNKENTSFGNLDIRKTVITATNHQTSLQASTHVKLHHSFQQRHKPEGPVEVGKTSSHSHTASISLAEAFFGKAGYSAKNENSLLHFRKAWNQVWSQKRQQLNKQTLYQKLYCPRKNQKLSVPSLEQLHSTRRIEERLGVFIAHL